MTHFIEQRDSSDTIHVPVGNTDDVLLFDSAPNDSTSLLLTIPEVARLLKVSQTSIRRLQLQREIPFIKVGGSVRFSREDVFSYLRRRRVDAIG